MATNNYDFENTTLSNDSREIMFHIKTFILFYVYFGY